MNKHIKQYALWAGLALGSAGLAQADTLVTFQVDMTQQISQGTFTPGANVVNARGTFNGYGTAQLTNNPSGSNPNLYTGTFADTSDANGATLQYKYCIDSGTWETGICNGNNRTAGLPANGGALTLPIVYFNDAAPSLTPVNDNITFQVDMTEQVVIGNFTPDTDGVWVRGSFNGWGQTQLTNNPSGSNTNLYSMVIPVSDVPLNLQHFKYYIDRNANWEGPSALNVDCTGNRFVNLLAADGDITLPPVYFGDLPPAPPLTNVVTFQVDMSVQASLGKFDYTLGDTVECRGSFNNWNGGAFVLTNDPSAANSNLFTGTLNIIVPPTTITYKFWDSDANAGNNGYESPASTSGNNRSFTLVNSNATLTVPVVYYADLTSSSDFLTEDTAVTFTVNMTNATDTGSIAFNPSIDQVYLNGDWIPWWAWNDPFQAYLGYQLTNNPVGSGLYTLTVTIPKGDALTLNYKYSINGADNELPQYVNHVRSIRTLGTYAMPLDKFGTQVTEPTYGQLSVGAPANGKVPVSWLGRPGVSLQTRSSLTTGSWQSVPATDGASWSNGYMSSNGFVSVTNYPTSGGQGFFRLVKP